jgi:type II secretory pathway pseudopilin PulG
MTATLGTRWAGFNLVETLVATMILSGSVLALATISTNALTDTTRNRHYEQAAAIIDEQLSMIDYVGIDQLVKLEQTEGDNEDFGFAYHWKVSTEYEGTDNLYIVTITVTWVEGSRPYSVSAQTMLDGTSMTATPSETVQL